MSKTKLNEIIKLVNKIAEQDNIHPSQVKQRDLINNGVTAYELSQLGGFNSIKKANFPVTEKALKEIYENKNTNKYIAKLEKALAEKTINDEKILSTLKSIKLPNIKPYKTKAKSKINREVNLILSDLHFGSDINKKESGSHNYGINEESRRFAKIIQETIEYKPQYRNNTKLNVSLLGDLIQGNLGHDPRDGAPLTEQICRAIYLLSQGLAHLVETFPEVKVYVNSGNHSRNINRHPGRAVHSKWDSYETIIAFSLKQIFKTYKNIEFIIPMTPYVTYEVFGSKMFLTHGDTVLNPGYIGKAINTGSLEGQINKINASLKDADEYKVWVVGHIHVGSVVHLSNGSTLITNGALCPTDEYAVSIGLLESCAGQMLFESVKDYPVGDVRYIRVSEKEDSNSELDKLIQPYKGL